MNNKIEQIIEELIKLDPELKKYREELPEIVNSLILLKPNLEINDNFRAELKNKLIEKMLSSPKNKNNNFNYMKKINYALGGILMLLVLSLPLWFYQKGNDLNKLAQVDYQSFSINKIGKQAFGSLENDSTINAPTVDQAVGLGGGGGMAMNATKESSAIDSSMRIMPPYEIYNYKYIYQGESFEIPAEQMAVLKREKNNNQSGINLVKNLNLDLINLEKFANAKLQNFNLVEDKKFGYYINVNLEEGAISINENWNQWYGENDFQETKIEQVLSDQELINIADRFIADYKINTSFYGPAEVQNDWQMLYEKAADKSLMYIPPAATIIYPLLIEGKQVYDDWGNKQGLHLNVNFNQKKVINVWNINTQNYQSSEYQMETDVQKLLNIAEAGGLNYYPYSEGKTIEVAIGTPSIEYVRTWQYTNRENNELLVPALVFPILDQMENNNKQRIVIPLATELLKQQQNIIEDQPIRILK
ncbi:hypothetical protein H6761_00030 [Candidatus Nomurabacteria bacterium]|nr:hypothetical protein [Candidatus Nomurabacteria bacterium]